MENFYNILMIMIVVIFGLTAVIAIGSIPDWIKVPEWYKKKLFTVLIIEVVVLALTAFTNYLNRSGNETISYDKNTELSLKYFANNDSIYACTPKDTLGKFSKDKLKYDELFTHIPQPVSDHDDYTVIKWTANKKTKKWKNGSKNQCAIMGCPFYTRVGYVDKILSFQIFKEGEETPYFCSRTSNINEFDDTKDNRRVYLFEYMDEKEKKTRYVLFRIISALTKDKLGPDGELLNQYVHILQIRIKPELDLKKISSI